MARSANYFVNPKTGGSYLWPVNHTEEDEAGRRRAIEHTANTSGTALVRQQGSPDPLIFRLKGTIFHESQLAQMIAFWKLCEGQTIYWYDFAGDQYEVMMTAFMPKRLRTLRNPRDPTNAPLWYWSYDMDLEVIRIITGPWAGT